MSGAKNCPETPRQKMIGMMYLVLTAMLALNVSTDILNGFTMVDQSMVLTIKAYDKRINLLYREFEAANEDNPEKIQEWYDKALEVRHRADSLYNAIYDFKEQIAILADGKKAVAEVKAKGLDPTLNANIEGKDNRDVSSQYAVVNGHGKELKELTIYFRDYAASLVDDDAELRESILNSLKTDPIYSAQKKDSLEWEEFMFEEMPVCATVTLLTKMHSDVQLVESQVLQHLMDRTDAGDLRVNKVNAYVIPESKYVIRGGKYRAQIIMAAVDTTKKPEYYVDGLRLNEHGIYEVTANSVGQKKYTGWISYMNPATGEMDQLTFKSEYSVGEPAVTISNTDLNIMYRGYENKFSISVPGIGNDKVNVTVNGASCKQESGLWIIRPNDNTKSVTITVMAELDGKMQPMGSKEYRVKALPNPQAFFSARDKEYASGSTIAPSTLTHSSGVVTASYGPDGLLDLPFKVTSFRAIINGSTTPSDGNKFTKEQLNQIGKLKKGGMVVLQDIRAIGPGGQEKRLSPILLTLN